MPLRKSRISSVGDLLDALNKIHGTIKNTVWYRGHGCIDWKLLPSLLRPPLDASQEIVLLKRFKQQSFPFLERIPLHEWEWLFLMQHHGVQTRLLDWTESPLVGLYFALQEPTERRYRGKDSVLWCLYPHKLNSIANLQMDPPNDIPCFGDDKVLESYLPTQVVGVKTTDKKPVAIIAPRQFKRLYAQQGVFTLFHRNNTPIENLGTLDHIYKVIIPASKKVQLRKELDFLMINEVSLFPELEKVGKLVKEYSK